MPPKELDKINLEIRKRKAELFEIDEGIRKSNIKKSHLEHDTAETQEGLISVRDAVGEWGERLNQSKIEAKKIISEAKQVLKQANDGFKRAKDLVAEKIKDLKALDRDKGIAAKVKEQLRENVSKNKELDKELRGAVDKGIELENLIAKQKDVDSIKKVLEASKEELQSVIDSNLQGGRDVEDALEQLSKKRVELKSEIARHSTSTKEMEAATRLLNETIDDNNNHIREMENKRVEDIKKNDMEVYRIEADRKVLDADRLKIDRIIEKMKKNKNLTDDLKAVGLLRW